MNAAYATHSGGIIARPIANQLGMFLNGGLMNVQFAIGDASGETSTEHNYANDAWHVGLAMFAGAAAGASVRTDGAADGEIDPNTIVPLSTVGARRLVLGGYGLNADTIRLMILPFDLSAPANTRLLGNVQAKMLAYRRVVAA